MMPVKLRKRKPSVAISTLSLSLSLRSNSRQLSGDSEKWQERLIENRFENGSKDNRAGAVSFARCLIRGTVKGEDLGC
jgi:hypothetical protein